MKRFVTLVYNRITQSLTLSLKMDIEVLFSFDIIFFLFVDSYVEL